MAAVDDDRGCPYCPDQLHLVHLGSDQADQWALVHRSGRNCQWRATYGGSVGTIAAPLSLTTAKDASHSKHQ